MSPFCTRSVFCILLRMHYTLSNKLLHPLCIDQELFLFKSQFCHTQIFITFFTVLYPPLNIYVLLSIKENFKFKVMVIKKYIFSVKYFDLRGL